MFAEDREYAFQRLETLNENIGGTQQSSPIPIYQKIIATRSLEDEWACFAPEIWQRHKNEEQFSGKMKEHFRDYLNNYNEAFSYYNVSSPQKIRLVHSLFDGKAKQILIPLKLFAPLIIMTKFKWYLNIAIETNRIE